MPHPTLGRRHLTDAVRGHGSPPEAVGVDDALGAATPALPRAASASP
nr:hypothetical protein [uncultured Albidiferax sp.]